MADGLCKQPGPLDTLIFKRALLAVAAIDDLVVIIPTHDALLFEYTLTKTPAGVVDAFERVMTDVLGGRVTGKASISDFAERDSPVATPTRILF